MDSSMISKKASAYKNQRNNKTRRYANVAMHNRINRVDSFATIKHTQSKDKNNGKF